MLARRDEMSEAGNCAVRASATNFDNFPVCGADAAKLKKMSLARREMPQTCRFLIECGNSYLTEVGHHFVKNKKMPQTH